MNHVLCRSLSLRPATLSLPPVLFPVAPSLPLRGPTPSLVAVTPTFKTVLGIGNMLTRRSWANEVTGRLGLDVWSAKLDSSVSGIGTSPEVPARREKEVDGR